MIKLSDNEKEILNKLSVRTAKLDHQNKQYNIGTGTIFASNNNYYVLTAGHCVDGVDEQHIVVEYYNGSSYVNTKVLKIIICKYDKKTEEDFAVLLVDAPKTKVDYESLIKRFH